MQHSHERLLLKMAQLLKSV